VSAPENIAEAIDQILDQDDAVSTPPAPAAEEPAVDMATFKKRFGATGALRASIDDQISERPFQLPPPPKDECKPNSPISLCLTVPRGSKVTITVE
jgi:hypothetical protein